MFALIDNRGPNTVIAYLRRRSFSAQRLRIAVAFITTSGVSEIENVFTRVVRHGEAQILTGFYQGFTEPAALRRLLHFADRHPTFELRVSKRAKFHPKIYLIDEDRSSTAIIGSSNLTAEGLTTEGEANLVHRGRASTEARMLNAYFEDEWAESVAVTVRDIQQYESSRVVQPKKSRLTRSISSILNLNGRESNNRLTQAANARGRRFWIDGFRGELSERTMREIRDETDWDRKGYFYYSLGRHSMRRDDRLLMFNFTETPGTVTFARMVEETTLPRSTPDGRSFVAYVPLRGTRSRILSEERLAELRSIGAYVRRSRIARSRIGQSAWVEACKVFGVRPASA
jgi:HKD family nuclease